MCFKRIKPTFKPKLLITYMMYQQDDRLFNKTESFGLKVISEILNTLHFDTISVFHPHSDKIEFINNVEIIDNSIFVQYSIQHFNADSYWVIPDSGAFKTQFKQIQDRKFPNFITCMKSRAHKTGDIETVVNAGDLDGRDCFIVDDICLGGRTFINIAEKLRENNCGKLYLVVSHGIFNNGIDHLLEYFDKIFTTDSICNITHDKLEVFKIL